jgi:hypothetical protein
MIKVTYKYKTSEDEEWKTNTYECKSTNQCINDNNLLDDGVIFEFIGIEGLEDLD